VVEDELADVADADGTGKAFKGDVDAFDEDADVEVDVVKGLD